MSRPATLISTLAGLEDLLVHAEEPLAGHTTLRIGGAAEVFVQIESEAALQSLMRTVHDLDRPFHLLGIGSNVLLPDEGLKGVVGVLKGRFLEYEVDGGQVIAGAGMPLARLARQMAVRGLLGLEALAGFPSTVGGAVYMNAGCYGVEISDLLVSVKILTSTGELQSLAPRDLDAAYRSTSLQGSGSLVTAAVFQLRQGDPGEALATMEELNRRRWASLPSGSPNAGSIFKNPSGDYAGRLIEACGLKGVERGGAQFSRQHANVIVNQGRATARDVLDLMVLAHRQVRLEFDVDLEPEIVLTGSLLDTWRQTVGKAAV